MLNEKLNAAMKSVYVNSILITVKLAAGILTGSLGIIAEFIHSFFDLMASVFAYIGIKKASEPADKHHRYGHERVENISSLFQSALIALTSILILYEAYRKITKGGHIVKESIIGIAVMLLTLVADIIFSRYLHKKSSKTGSPALQADAYHFSTDVWSTAAVIIGLGAAHLGYPLFDVLGAVFVALLMLYLSVRLGIKAFEVMLDHVPDDRCLEEITSMIAKYPGVKGFHSLRAREAGSRVFVDVSIHLDRSLQLEKAHSIAESLELKIMKSCPKVKEVVVHVEPECLHDVEKLSKDRKQN